MDAKNFGMDLGGAAARGAQLLITKKPSASGLGPAYKSNRVSMSALYGNA